ncbi:MAG: hypothetical protein FWE14_06945 [Lachnospiraceae bacterium]|nr:hypothetical protein [Lachnospiraceae bacterium]
MQLRDVFALFVYQPRVGILTLQENRWKTPALGGVSCRLSVRCILHQTKACFTAKYK